MPIEGLSSVIRIPRLGKIKLGIKKLNAQGVEYPEKTEYFVLPKEHPQYQDLVDLFGEKPKLLHILIPTEDAERWCSQYYRCYSKSRGLVCKGDGKTASRMVAKGTDNLAWKDAKEVEMKSIECPGKNCEIYMQRNCNEIMNLQFMIPEVPGLGVWQINTTSINSIININSAAFTIKEIYKRLTNIPLLLTLEPQEGRIPKDGKKTTFYVLNLRVGIKLSDLAIAARQQQEQFALPIGDTEMPDDEELGYQPTFDPAPPDTHTAQENIDEFWPEDKKPEPVKTLKKTDTPEVPNGLVSFTPIDGKPKMITKEQQLAIEGAVIKDCFNAHAVIVRNGWNVTKPSELTYEQAETLLKEYQETKKIKA